MAEKRPSGIFKKNDRGIQLGIGWKSRGGGLEWGGFCSSICQFDSARSRATDRREDPVSKVWPAVPWLVWRGALWQALNAKVNETSTAVDNAFQPLCPEQDRKSIEITFIDCMRVAYR